MQPGQRLTPDTEVREHGAALRYQSDGNVVLYGPPGALWASGTSAAAGYLEMQGDGNLVAYDAAGVPYWASDTLAPGAHLEIRRTGLQIVLAGAVVWEIATGWVEPEGEPVPAGHPDPLSGQVRLVNGAFGDATGPRNICALHLGDLIGHGLLHGVEAIRPALVFASGCGYHVVRSWWQLHIRPGDKWLRGPTEDGWDPRADRQRFAEILALGASLGLKWHLAAAALKHLGQSDKDALFDCLADAVGNVGPEAFALIEGANESRDTTDETPASLERLVQRVRGRFPAPLYSLTAFTGHEDRAIDKLWTPSWQAFVMRHCSRSGHFHDKVRHIFSGAYEGELVRRNLWRGEPFGVGPGVSAQDHGHELTSETMPLAGAMAAMTRCVWTFMSTPGVVYGREPLASQAGIVETPALLRKLPRDVGTFRTLGHSGPSKKGQRIHAVRDDSPDVRADYAIADDGRYVELIYGPPDQRKDLNEERVTWDRSVLHDVSWGRVETGRLS